MKRLLIIPLLLFCVTAFGQWTKPQLYENINTNIRLKTFSATRLSAVLDSIVVSMGTGSMVYPGAGIPLSTGSAWGTSITDNSANWNTAYGWGNHAGLYPLLSDKVTDFSVIDADKYPATSAFYKRRTVTGADAIVQSDRGKTIYFDSATPFNFTIDNLEIDTEVYFRNVGAGAVSFVNGSGVSYSGATTLAPNELGGITYYTTTTPIISKANDIQSATSSVAGITKLYTSTGTNTDGAMDQNSINTALGTKQDALISGTNIKTVAGTSLLGSGNVPLPALGVTGTHTMTGVSTLTSNSKSQLIINGTTTSGSAGLSFMDFGGSNTSFSGTGQNYAYRFNPTMIGNGTGSTQVAVQINPSFSGGTSPISVFLQVGNTTPIANFDFQSTTGYFSSTLRFDGSIRDNRDNSIITQSASGLSSNRILTIGNTSYSSVNFSHAGSLLSTQSAVNTGIAPTSFKVVGGAHTNLTLNNPVMDVYFNIGRTVQSAAGTITNNRYVYIENPTHSFVGASTSSREVTVAIKGAPTAGTNATFTNSIGLEVESSNVTAGTATSYGIYTNAQTGASINYALGVNGTMTLSSPANDDALTQVLVRDGTTGEVKYRTSSSIVGGDVVGPSSSVAGTLALFDGTTGKLLKEAVSATNRVTSDGGQILFEKVSSVTGNNLIRASNGGAGENHAMGLLLLGGNASGSNYDGGDVIIQSGNPHGSGARGAIRVADAADKLGFFDATPVVKQSAPTTAQEIADVLTAYGLIPSATISGGGGGISDGGDATNADFTASVNTVYNLPAATLSTNRTITIPAGSDMDVIEIYNEEAGFTWNLTGSTVYLSDGTTAVTSLLAQTNYVIRKVSGKWKIKN